VPSGFATTCPVAPASFNQQPNQSTPTVPARLLSALWSECEVIMSYRDSYLPPIVITTSDLDRLRLLASSAMTRFPYAASYLAREIDRADIVPPLQALRGLVRMGSRVAYLDHGCDRIREVTLVFPHEADIDQSRISILTPVGAALIGLSVGQSIEFETPGGEKRSLTVLRVSD
jgi:regulator of nucleoside diphosphate kinase